MTHKLATPLKTHGGKSYMVRHLLPLLPTHTSYVEAYAGGASLLLRKEPAHVEVLNDLNPRTTGTFTAIRDRCTELVDRLGALTYDLATFEAAKAADIAMQAFDPHDMHGIVNHIVRVRMSRGGSGEAFAWSDRLRGGMPGDVNGWINAIARMPAISQRLKQVTIRNDPASKVIGEVLHDPDCVSYVDPPYPALTRVSRKAYGKYEMTDDDHVELLDLLKQARGRVVLSGYACQLYDQALAGWTRTVIDMPNHSAQGKAKQRRREIIWSNYATPIASATKEAA